MSSKLKYRTKMRRFTFYLYIPFHNKNLVGRALPEDDWFAEVAQIAIKMLTGKANFSHVEREVTSLTQTISSVYPQE